MNLNYNWKLADGYPPLTRGKVFSCFACGGGSTMGYKLAGFDVIGCNEIDPRMMEAYKVNHHPRLAYLEDIRTFKNRTDLPAELYNLDILDGSPPCSSFSMAGAREDGWGVEKKFREGQAEQVLDTLFFDFIDLAKKLQPKVVVVENVKGLLMGEAREYYKRILFAMEDAGYEVQDFLLNAADMGVPQERERVFFIALRKDLCGPFMEQVNLFHQKPSLAIGWNMDKIPYSQIEDKTDTEDRAAPSYKKWWLLTKPGDLFSSVHPTKSFFCEVKLDLNKTINTLTSQGKLWHPTIPRKINKIECLLASSFPTDYNTMGQQTHYICGMSVPPLMVARVANEIWEQWLSRINKESK